MKRRPSQLPVAICYFQINPYFVYPSSEFPNSFISLKLFAMRKLLFLAAIISFIGCKKETDQKVDNKPVIEEQSVAAKKPGPPQPTGYTTYTIREGQHYCDQNTIKSVRTSEMKFMAKFDNSAIYTSVIPENQYDIHKLWGFTEGINNQYNSARVG